MTTETTTTAFTFVWKLVDGDFYEQNYSAFSSVKSAVAAWEDFWGITWRDCEKFSITMKEE